MSLEYARYEPASLSEIMRGVTSWPVWQSILSQAPQDWHSDWHVFLLCIGGWALDLPDSESGLGALYISVGARARDGPARLRISVVINLLTTFAEAKYEDPAMDGDTAVTTKIGSPVS